MLLCLDVGNSQIFAGLFDNQSLVLKFRYDSRHSFTSDQFGVFIRGLLREHNFDPQSIKQVALASVVPELDYSIRAGCIKYLNCDPFILKAGVKTGLKIKYHNPLEVGADRIANAIAACSQFPNQNIMVVSLGTATTFCCITEDKSYLGGAIFPGFSLCMNALQEGTSKLKSVSIAKPEQVVGQSTYHAIQSGLYYGQLGTIKEQIFQATRTVFNKKPPCVIGTGGFSHLFEGETVFNAIIPDLVLHGIRLANNQQ
ncbi:type III pantothenate kinase [Candidatus Berkiella cookevillensis]|uniref:Type III pantothenate kinase n=1 Tax=Candidatus Berkiella cookevillensis TaxID=437022 RepID=A0A0Q9YST6_9GAMM|nr:type III pantothenate kinase [Candidatus Berkiella cookevillensis]MCS5708502.1 type III pantothenate kinase [Candidatus Berkiella cookevillensis]